MVRLAAHRAGSATWTRNTRPLNARRSIRGTPTPGVAPFLQKSTGTPVSFSRGCLGKRVRRAKNILNNLSQHRNQNTSLFRNAIDLMPTSGSRFRSLKPGRQAGARSSMPGPLKATPTPTWSRAMFGMEWPSRSGWMQEFPEVDRPAAQFYGLIASATNSPTSPCTLVHARICGNIATDEKYRVAHRSIPSRPSWRGRSEGRRASGSRCAEARHGNKPEGMACGHRRDQAD